MNAVWSPLLTLAHALGLAPVAGRPAWPLAVVCALLRLAERHMAFATVSLGLATMGPVPQAWDSPDSPHTRARESLAGAREVLFAELDDPALVLDAAEQIVDANPAARALCLAANATPVALIQQGFQRALAELPPAAEHRRASARFPLTLGDRGEVRSYDVHVCALDLSHGRAQGYLVVLHDVTELSRDSAAREALRAARMAADAARREEQRRWLEADQRQVIAESLRQVLAILNERRPRAEVLGTIVRQAANLLGSEAAAIYGPQHPLASPLARPQARALTLQAEYGLPASYQENTPLPLAHAAARRALAARWPVVVQHPCVPPADGAQRRGRELAPGAPSSQVERLPHGHQALLVVPIVGRDEVFGCLLLFYRALCHFTADELALAMAYAGQVALAMANARLQAQIQREAAETEQRRLGHDLHDTVSQDLFSMALLAENIPRLWRKHRREAEQGLEQLRRLIASASAAVRMLLLERRPETLEKMPLADLLRQLGEATSMRALAPVWVQISGEKIHLPTAAKLAFYRVAREALTNAAKHARARTITVRLRLRRSGSSVLEIVDDGQGFDTAAVPVGHYGVAMMREHAASIGASVRIESQMGSGTQVIMEWRRGQARSASRREETADAAAKTDPRRDR